MKTKIFSIMVLGAMVAMTSCSNDDDLIVNNEVSNMVETGIVAKPISGGNDHPEERTGTAIRPKVACGLQGRGWQHHGHGCRQQQHDAHPCLSEPERGAGIVIRYRVGLTNLRGFFAICPSFLFLSIVLREIIREILCVISQNSCIFARRILLKSE